MIISRQIIEREWPLTHVRIVKTILGKDERTIVLATSTEGDYVFKIAHHDKPEAILKKDVTVLHFLQKKNFTASPTILKTHSGHLYTRVSSCLVYALKYIEGVTPAPSPRTWQKFGKTLASLHLIEPSQKFKSNFTVKSQRVKMLKLARSFGTEPRYAEMWKKLPNFRNLPQSMIHTDAALNNAIERADGSLVLLDWDDAGRGPCVLDIGFVLTSFLTSGLRFQQTNATAFLKGYSLVRRIRKQEKRYAVDAGLFFGLSYSIHKQKGADAGYWRWTQYIADHRNIFENVLRTIS